ncbi:large subunit ribosomal protein L42, partial [Paragonimus westermani]
SKVSLSGNTSVKHRNPVIIVSSDGATIVCWHPQKDISYESTKAIPRDLDALKAPVSPLNIRLGSAINEARIGPTVLELSKAFGLPWQHFRPRAFTKRFSPYAWAPLRERKSL